MVPLGSVLVVKAAAHAQGRAAGLLLLSHVDLVSPFFLGILHYVKRGHSQGFKTSFVLERPPKAFGQDTQLQLLAERVLKPFLL